jgi:hypothetical protein
LFPEEMETAADLDTNVNHPQCGYDSSTTCVDVMIFAGMEPEQALRAVHPDSDQEPPNS